MKKANRNGSAGVREVFGSMKWIIIAVNPRTAEKINKFLRYLIYADFIGQR